MLLMRVILYHSVDRRGTFSVKEITTVTRGGFLIYLHIARELSGETSSDSAWKDRCEMRPFLLGDAILRKGEEAGPVTWILPPGPAGLAHNKSLK
jgi:hypothetical protein